MAEEDDDNMKGLEILCAGAVKTEQRDIKKSTRPRYNNLYPSRSAARA